MPVVILIVFNSYPFTVNSTAGPMASCVDGLILMTKAFSTKEMFEADPNIPLIPLNETVSTTKNWGRVNHKSE